MLMTSRTKPKKEIVKQATYSTGEVARIIDVSGQTVINYCERQMLKCSRIGGTGPRKISHDVLIEFMTDMELDIPKELV